MSRNLPKTSLDAFTSVKDDLSPKHRDIIISALSKLGLATGEEIAAETGLDFHQVMRRTSELEVGQMIYRTGIKRKTRKGRDAFCYTLTNSSHRKQRTVNNKSNRPVQQTLL